MRSLKLWLVLGLVGISLVLGVHLMSRREQTLVEHQNDQRRVVACELRVSQSVRIPIDPGADVLRIDARSFWHSGATPTPGRARLTIAARGESGSRSETVTIPLLSSDGEAHAEDADITVGDDRSTNIDTHDLGPGVLTITLSALTGSEGLLLRFYERHPLTRAELTSRRSALRRTAAELLARHFGHAAWSDLNPTQQSALLSVIWKKTAPLADSSQAVVTRPLVLTEKSQSGVVHASTRDRPRRVDHARVQFFRASNAVPVVVEADAAALVLRVVARRPLLPGADPVDVNLTASITDPHGGRSQQLLSGEARPSPSDRYSATSGASTASQPVVFHVLVPPFGRLELKPAGTVDLTLYELDPSARPREVRNALQGEADANGSRAPWHGFIMRRPSNFRDFPASARGTLLLAKAGAAPERARASRERPVASSTPTRVDRPAGATTWKHEGRSYVPGHHRLKVKVPAGGAVLSLRLFARQATSVVVSIDGGAPRRLRAGAFGKVTTARTLRFRGDARLAVVLGDDLTPGIHEVSLQYDATKPVWMHAPWKPSVARRVASVWLSGGFAP